MVQNSLSVFNMFHVFAFTYYILLRCVTREYSMTSVTTKNYSIYATRKYTTTNDEKYSIYATREYTTIFDLHDACYSLLFFTRAVHETCFCCRFCNGRFFLNENLIKNLKLKIKLLISLRIHSYLFNKVQKSHSKKHITAVSNRSD